MNLICCYRKQSGHPEFKCITIPLSFHHVSLTPLCFPSTLTLTFSFLSPLISALKNSLPPPCHALSENSNPLDFNTFSYPLPISYLSRRLPPTAWLLCHQGSAFVSFAPMFAPQLGAPNPQVLLTATLLLVLPYRHFINSIYEEWISNI